MPKTEAPKPPNPGSDAAVALGCTCARMDNNHGRFAPWPPDGWWITAGCPVHDPKPEAAPQTKGDR